MPVSGVDPLVFLVRYFSFSASLIVFALSALLAASLPGIFRPVSTDLVSLAGVLLVLSGLYLLATGRR